MRNVLSVLASSFFVLPPLAACGGAQSPGDAEQPSLVGRWASDCIAASPQQVFRLEFELDATRWKLDYRAFADGACGTPFLTVHIEGAYELTGPSAEVAGASHARFGFAVRNVTPHLEAAAQFLASNAGCDRAGFAVGVATDILEQGCAGLGAYPLAACPAELDLAWREATTLRLGARPADGNLCTEDRRPKALSPVALTLQP